MMLDKLKNYGVKFVIGSLLVLSVFCLYFSFFMIDGNITIEKLHPGILALGTIVYLSLIITAKISINFCTEKQLKQMTLVLFIVLGIGLTFFGFSFCAIPNIDLKHLHIEAVNMLKTHHITNLVYFGKYPYQKNLTIFLYFVYQIGSWMGIKDFRLLGILLNICMIVLSAYLLYRIVLEGRGRKSAVFVLVCFVTMPVFYLYSSYYYTDIISIPFMLSGIWLSLRTMYAKKTKNIIFYAICAGIVTILGTKIRTTVLFVIIATIFIFWIKNHWKKFISLLCTLLAGIILGTIVYLPVTSIYGGDINTDQKFPPTHFIMMGLNESTNGGYSQSDHDYTFQQNTYKDKISANTEIIKERLSEMDADDLVTLINKKIARMWADGTNRYQSYIDIVKKYNPIYEYAIGEKSIFLKYLMQFMRCTLFLLLIISLIKFLLKKNLECIDLINTILLFGTFLFYLIWEVQARYSLSFLPIMLIVAEPAMDTLTSWIGLKEITVKGTEKQYTFDKTNLSRILRCFWIIILAATFFTGAISFHKYTGVIEERAETRVNQKTGYWASRIQKIDTDGVTQSFRPYGNFNQVGISFRNPDQIKGNEYYFRIWDENGELLEEQSFLSDDVKDNQYKYFSFNTIYDDEQKLYYVQIVSAEEYESSIVINAAYEKPSEEYVVTYDFYPDGAVVTDGFEQNTDIMFKVQYLSERPFVSTRVYCFMWFGSLFLEAVIFHFLYKYAKGSGISDKVSKKVKRRGCF